MEDSELPASHPGLSVEESDRLSQERMKEIEEEIKRAPLTSSIRSLTELATQFKNEATSSTFLSGLSDLEKQYQGIRFVRGDGNCYYRAFLFSLAEKLSKAPKEETQRILAFVRTESWENVKKAGYEEMTIEMFYDEAASLIERAGSGSIDDEALSKELNEENSTSDYCTWYFRVITATQLKMDPERFLPFIEQPGLDIAQFCQREVEPMGKECEQLQVLALAEAFGIQVQIEYLDGHDLVNGNVTHHVFGADVAATKLHFLYRPGHYDILYPKA